MARGWESKAVEDQVQEAQSKDNRSNKGQLTPTDIELNRQREVLVLSRTRVQRELESSQNPRYKEQLTRALADLDAQLADLSVPD
jgi:hypothetical protein